MKKNESRRGFLGTVATGVATVGLAAIANPFKAGAHNTFVSSGNSDNEAWFKNIQGKHRIVFDAPAYNEGMPLVYPRVFQLTNNSSGIDTKDLGIVVVFRHNGIPLSLNSATWAKYRLGEMFSINDPATGKPFTRNRFWQPAAGELEIPGMSINELQESGTLFCVCEMALMHYSGVVAGKMGLAHEQVRKDWMEGLLPNVKVVPSGVFAVNRAQENGCTYCFAG